MTTTEPDRLAMTNVGGRTLHTLKTTQETQERKLDEIIRLLNKLIEIEEANFRMRWGKDFVSNVQSTEAAAYTKIQQHMPRASSNKKLVLPKTKE